jgi:type II secretory ATPase GspE/PulE/Tfp pilus assembly ATPase PilB-like protein
MCGQTGYFGRFAVYEYIVFDEALRDRIILDRAAAPALLREKSSRIMENGARNVRLGETSAAEVIRALFRP